MYILSKVSGDKALKLSTSETLSYTYDTRSTHNVYVYIYKYIYILLRNFSVFEINLLHP